jgi:hypothetical protein
LRHAQFSSRWFVNVLERQVQHLDSSMWLIDAGDHENDGKSELVFPDRQLQPRRLRANAGLKTLSMCPLASRTPTALSLGRYENYQYFPHATDEYDASNRSV